ncbi:hypothetical protein CVS40_4437 [Lucilia cuprina]|nr:hypothetical protein CVS40_4437 [Lucilia cuprina]
MGLNDFVSLFYGSAQNLNTSSSSSSTFLSSSSTDVENSLTFNQASTTLEMLKNHKNSKLPKFNLNDFSTSDVKFSRNMTLTSIKTPRQKGIILSGGENCNSVSGGKSGRNNRNATSTSAIHKLHSSSSSVSLSTVQTNAKTTASTALYAASVSTTGNLPSTTTTTSVAVASTNEMDLLKAPGLRKKSSFLWNSFRMPRKQKGGESRD